MTVKFYIYCCSIPTDDDADTDGKVMYVLLSAIAMMLLCCEFIMLDVADVTWLYAL